MYLESTIVLGSELDENEHLDKHLENADKELGKAIDDISKLKPRAKTETSPAPEGHVSPTP